MSDVAPVPVIPFSDASIEKCLIEAQGDLNVAADLLGHVTVRRLDRAIRASDRLQRVYLGIKQIKSEYDRISQEQLGAELERRLTIYRSDALESIHELATMPVGDNSAMAQVKLAAAARLSGPIGRQDGASDLEATLLKLNEEYHEHAPRIRVTREKTSIEIEAGAQRPAIEVGATRAE